MRNQVFVLPSVGRRAADQRRAGHAAEQRLDDVYTTTTTSSRTGGRWRRDEMQFLGAHRVFDDDKQSPSGFATTSRVTGSHPPPARRVNNSLRPSHPPRVPRPSPRTVTPASPAERGH